MAGGRRVVPAIAAVTVSTQVLLVVAGPGHRSQNVIAEPLVTTSHPRSGPGGGPRRRPDRSGQDGHPALPHQGVPRGVVPVLTAQREDGHYSARSAGRL